ncbi:unnamed protein product, partial [Rotaria sordida]
MQLNLDNAKMCDDENHTIYCIRHYLNDDIVSIGSNSLMLMSSIDHKQIDTKQSNFDYPLNWTVDDVTKWLDDISLQQYSDNFRKNDIDALRILRSRAHTPHRPGSTFNAIKQESEEHCKLLQTIQQQAEQISSLISTVNTQAKQIEQFVAKLSAMAKQPLLPIDVFSKSSSIVQNQLLDLPSNTSKIALASFDTPTSAIPTIDSVVPSILPLPANSHISSSTTTTIPVSTSVEDPQGSSGVTFPAVIHPNIDCFAIKPVIDDIYNFQNYGKYAITIFDQNSENILIQTLVNVAPENEICIAKKFLLRDSINNILIGATVKLKLHDEIIFTDITDSTGIINLPTTLQKNCYDIEIHTNDIQHKPSIFRMIVYKNRGSDI